MVAEVKTSLKNNIMVQWWQYTPVIWVKSEANGLVRKIDFIYDYPRMMNQPTNRTAATDKTRNPLDTEKLTLKVYRKVNNVDFITSASSKVVVFDVKQVETLESKMLPQFQQH